MASGFSFNRIGPGNLATLTLATLSTGLLFFYGTGLEPRWFLTWFAPLPVLLLAPHITGRKAAGAAFVGYLLGTMNIAEYYLNTLELPIPLAVGVFVSTSAIFCGAVLTFRMLVLDKRMLLAVVSFSAAIAGAEYLLAATAPGGANWSLAPSQADVLPVIQIASLVGIWGISFLVSAVPAAIAALATRGPSRSARYRLGVGAAVAMAATLIFGFIHSGQDRAADTVAVTLLAARLPAPEPILDVGTPSGARLFQADLAALAHLPRGTEIAVFPEKDLLVDEGSLSEVSKGFGSIAREKRITIVVGIEMHAKDGNYNEALIFASDGTLTVYKKQFMLPGVEDALTTGTANSFVPGYDHQVGVAICADMGHPTLGRSYSRDGAGLMVVPALDFTTDAWSQSRVQYLRGVENGYSVVRAARLGYLTITGSNGRVIDEVQADSAGAVSMVSASVPLGTGTTLYSRFGDWFAWLALASAIVGVAFAVRARRRRKSVGRIPSAPSTLEHARDRADNLTRRDT